MATASLALNISEQTLRALQSAGQIFPIPGVAIAAGVALEILQIVQVSRELLSYSARTLIHIPVHEKHQRRFYRCWKGFLRNSRDRRPKSASESEWTNHRPREPTKGCGHVVSVC